MRKLVQQIVIGLAYLSAGSAMSQDGTTIQLKLDPADASVELCRTALETGRILRTDETGVYLHSGYHIVHLEITEGALICSAKFVRNP